MIFSRLSRQWLYFPDANKTGVHQLFVICLKWSIACRCYGLSIDSLHRKIMSFIEIYNNIQFRKHEQLFIIHFQLCVTETSFFLPYKKNYWSLRRSCAKIKRLASCITHSLICYRADPDINNLYWADHNRILKYTMRLTKSWLHMVHAKPIMHTN